MVRRMLANTVGTPTKTVNCFRIRNCCKQCCCRYKFDSVVLYCRWTEYGPYDTITMSQWYAAGQLPADLNIRKGLDVVPESEQKTFLNEDYIM